MSSEKSVTVAPLPHHLPMLDGLRGIAILVVLVHNLAILDNPTGLPGRALEAGLDLGWIGVTLFFALSGFLITRGLLESRDSPTYYRDFYARRILRIFPLYYATLAFFFILLPLAGHLPEQVARGQDHQVWLWLFLCNWTMPYHPAGNALPHFWSLAVEEQFYLLWPWIVHRQQPDRLLRLCLVLAVASLAARVLMLAAGADPEAVYLFTFARMDALALGAAAAAVTCMPARLAWATAARGRLLAATIGLWVAGLVVTHGYPRILPAGQTIGYTVLAVAFAASVLVAACSEPSGTPRTMRMLRWPFLRVMGKYSYGMYVIHKPLHDMLARPFLASRGYDPTPSVGIALAYMAVGILVTLLAAMLSYRVLEAPFLRLKARFAAGPRVDPAGALGSSARG